MNESPSNGPAKEPREYFVNPNVPEELDYVVTNGVNGDLSGPLNAKTITRKETENQSEQIIVAHKCNGKVHWNLTVKINKETGKREEEPSNFTNCDCV